VKRSALGGILTVTLVMTVLLLGYLYLSRTSSGYRMQKHQYTMSFFGDRIDALGKQRDLLLESASDLEEQATVLRKRIHMMDVEIDNMRERLRSEKKDSRAPFYSLDRLRFTTSSGLIVIAFLVFIWLLYTSTGKAGAPDGGRDEKTPAEGEVLAQGSVLEEEFQARSPAGSSEPPPDAEPAVPEEGVEPPAGGDEEASLDDGEEEPSPAAQEERGAEDETTAPSLEEKPPESNKDT